MRPPRLAGFLAALHGHGTNVLVTLILCGAPSAASASDARSPALPAHLVYGGDAQFPPFEYLDARGQPQGFNIELVREIAERLGLTVEFRLAPWTDTLASLDRGEIDLVSMGYTDGRASRYALLPRTWTLSLAVLFARGRATYPERLDLLHNETVAVESDSVMDRLLRGLEEVRRPALLPAPSQRAALALFARGRATAVAGNRLTLAYYAREARLTDFVAVPVKSVSYHLATQRARAAELAPFGAALETFRQGDGIDRLVERYLVVPERANGFWQRYGMAMGLTAVLGALLLAGTVVWNRSLARVVARRTEELSESEERYRDLFENANDLIQSVDVNGRLLYANRAWRETLGYRADELGALNLFDIVHPDSLDRCRDVFARVQAGEAAGVLQTEFVARDGRRITVEGTVSVKRDRDRPVATRAIFRDVTARTRAEDALRASESRSRSLIQKMLGGLVTITQQGVIESINPAAEEIFGYTEGELVGRHVTVLIPPALQHSKPDFLQYAFRESIGRVTEWDGQRKNGDVFPLELSFFEFHDGGGRHFAGNVRDISERREVDRLKNEFVAIVSHELRTPLTSIKGSLQLLRPEGEPGADAEHDQLVRVALNNTERLIRIVNDMLDVAKIEAGRLTLTLRRCQVAELVGAAIANVEAIACESSVAVETVIASGLPPVQADADRMVQALVNLLSNALKFAPAGSTVTVTAGPGSDGAVQIAVADRGAGIPADKIPLLFEKFQQLDGFGSRKLRGTGLGLTITKALVEQHHGHISVASEPGRGTTFTITLPADLGEAASPEGASFPAAP
jgi:two-component system sensor kinase FixL